MKLVKVMIIVFAVAGLSTLIVPYEGGGIPLTSAIKHLPTFLQFLAFFVPGLLMGLMMLKSPAPMWMPVVALAGFAFGFVRMETWRFLPRIADGVHLTPLIIQLSIVGGILFSIIAVVKPDRTA